MQFPTPFPPSGVSPSDITALSSRLGTLEDASTSLNAGSRLGTLEATALSVLPGTYTIGSIASPGSLPTPSAANLGSYAIVTDLYGTVTDKVLCRKVGASYYWVPLRPNLVATLNNPSASVTMGALTSAPILRITGAASANVTYTMSTVGAYPGAIQEFVMAGTLGIFGLTVAGLSAGATLGLILGARKRLAFDGTAWQDIS